MQRNLHCGDRHADGPEIHLHLNPQALSCGATKLSHHKFRCRASATSSIYKILFAGRHLRHQTRSRQLIRTIQSTVMATSTKAVNASQDQTTCDNMNLVLADAATHKLPFSRPATSLHDTSRPGIEVLAGILNQASESQRFVMLEMASR